MRIRVYVCYKQSLSSFTWLKWIIEKLNVMIINVLVIQLFYQFKK